MIALSLKHPSRQPLRFPGEKFWLSAVLFPLVFLAIWVSGQEPPLPERNAAPVAIAEDSTVTATITFIGDLMCHSPQFNCAKQPNGDYDFNASFEYVKPYFDASDFVIGNLETTCAGASCGYSGYPQFNSPDSYISALKNAGIDMVGTANNHSMDTGEKGLLRTLDILDEAGLAHTGSYRTQHDRDSVRIVNLKGIRVGILNYTYGTNGAYPAEDHKYLLNVADSSLVKNDVKLARAQGAEIVIVFYHWGIEYHPEPVPKQDSMMRYTVNAGADIIIGSHPHVIGPVDYFKTKNNAKLDTGLVAWTMGNFISNQSQRYTDAGLMLNFQLTKNVRTGEIKLTNTTYVPTWVYRGYDPSKKDYVVVPATWCGNDSLPSWISTESKTKMCGVLEDTKQIVGKYSSKPAIQH